MPELILQGIAEGRKDGCFGGPFFACRGQGCWGNERVEWLVRAIQEGLGKPVADLHSHPAVRVRVRTYLEEVLEHEMTCASGVAEGERMVPMEGFEPPTHALRMRCSTS